MISKKEFTNWVINVLKSDTDPWIQEKVRWLQKGEMDDGQKYDLFWFIEDLTEFMNNPHNRKRDLKKIYNKVIKNILMQFYADEWMIGAQHAK